MKKTLIALMAMSSVAFGETTITAEFTTAPSWKANFYSNDFTFVFTLDETYTIENSGSVLAAYWGTDIKENNNKWAAANAFVISSGENGSYTLTVGRGELVNFTYNESWESTTISNETTFAFSSTNQGTTPSTSVFSNIIELGVTYTLSVTGKDHNNTPILSWIDAQGVKQEKNGTVYTGNMTGNPPEGKNIVYGINSGKLIPEPTTATLSLLALAGLAARRRRK